MKRLISALLVVPVSVALLASASLVGAQTVTPNASCLLIPTNLSIGSTGTYVTALQNFLQSKGYLTVEPTGYFGTLTFAAVRSFQNDYNVPTVGSVGPITRAAIQIATCESRPHPDASPSASAASTTPQVFITVTNPATSTTATASSTVSLPYKADVFGDWQAAWGSVSTTSTGALHLEGTLTNNGAEAIYPASMDWTNYTYTANVNVMNGNISLIAHYVDANNFLACSFAKGWVEIDQVQNGTSTVLASKAVDGILPGIQGFQQNTTVGMTVSGDKVSCGGFGPTDNIAYTFPLNTAPKKGGIGIESWYQTALADRLDLLEVKVDPL